MWNGKLCGGYRLAGGHTQLEMQLDQTIRDSLEQNLQLQLSIHSERTVLWSRCSTAGSRIARRAGSQSGRQASFARVLIRTMYSNICVKIYCSLLASQLHEIYRIECQLSSGDCSIFWGNSGHMEMFWTAIRTKRYIEVAAPHRQLLNMYYRQHRRPDFLLIGHRPPRQPTYAHGIYTRTHTVAPHWHCWRWLVACCCWTDSFWG